MHHLPTCTVGISALLLITACSSDSNGNLATGGSGGGGQSGVAMAGNVAVAGAAGASAGAGGLGIAGLGAGGSAGASDAPTITLSVYNVVTERAVFGQDPTGGTLERVELPPSFTLVANVPPGTMSVQFVSDQSMRVDDTPPFLLHEAGSWDVSAGAHMVMATAFSQVGGQGEPLASIAQTLTVGETGLAPNFQPLSDQANTQWVTDNLDSVMQPLTFNGTQQNFDGSPLPDLPYRLFVPEDYDAGVKYPLVLFLHGRGDRGNDNRSATYNSRLFHGGRSIVSPNFRHQFPAIIVVPQCPGDPSYHEWARWIGPTDGSPQAGLVYAEGYYPSHPDPSPAAATVMELLDQLEQDYSIDATRIYITGQSMGGLGTWDITWRWPDVWAAATPLAGWTDPSRAELIVDIPFWAFHSTADTDNNVEGSRNMVARLMELDGNIRYTEYTDVNHGETFNKVWNTETELLPWIFSQQNVPAGAN